MLYRDIEGLFRWRLYAAGQAVAEAVEGFPDKSECLAAIEVVKGCAEAEIEDSTWSMTL